MNARIALKGLALVGLFLLVWWSLSQFDYIARWNIKSESEQLEDSLGDQLWKWMQNQYVESQDSLTKHYLNQIFVRLSENQDWDTSTIRIHLVEDDMVNAFALPGGHVIICRGLIRECVRSEQLAGVMAHELAHVQENHVMDKLVSEVGLTLLVGMISGGGTTAAEIAKFVLSNAYSRTVEEEADDVALELMKAARIDPNALVDFFYQLSNQEKDIPDALNWLSTHPGSRDRAFRLAQQITQDSFSVDSLIPWTQWQEIRTRYE